MVSLTNLRARSTVVLVAQAFSVTKPAWCFLIRMGTSQLWCAGGVLSLEVGVGEMMLVVVTAEGGAERKVVGKVREG